jgi:predicted secreted protein
MSPALVAIAALLAPLGCAHRPPPPAKITEVPLSAAHRAMEGSINLGEGVRLALPAPTRPGTQWVLLANEARVLEQLDALQIAPDGTATITFRARHLGRSVVRFAALRPNQTESVPSDVFQIAVEVNEP